MIRMYSEGELRTNLKTAGFTDPQIKLIVDWGIEIDADIFSLLKVEDNISLSGDRLEIHRVGAADKVAHNVEVEPTGGKVLNIPVSAKVPPRVIALWFK